MIDIQYIEASIWATFLGCILLFILPSERKSLVTVIFVFVNSVLTSIPAISALSGSCMEFTIQNFIFFGDIHLRLDALSGWFILIINFTVLVGAIYGFGYMRAYSGQHSNLTLHWISFLLFQLSMLLVVIVQNMLLFLIVWEIMSLSSLLLVIFDHEKPQTLKAGLNYLVQMHFGVMILTAGFIWVYVSQGSFDFLAIKSFFSENSNVWLFMLLFAGFGVKAGFVPLHSWLPHAHPAAPSHVSGVMSGVIVKMGIYGILRTIGFMQNDFELIGQIVLLVSLFTGFYGIVNAAVQRDFKRMLAYCTIENIGIIGTGIGLGLIGMSSANDLLVILGFGGALLHTFNHALFKALLFYSAGSVFQQTHSRNMEKLGGIIRQMPKTAILFLIGSLAISGLPPFNGFVSKFIIYSGFIYGMGNADYYNVFLMIFSVATLSVIGGISIYAFTKTFGVIFLGSPRTVLQRQPVEVAPIMRIPLYFIVVVMMSVAFFPSFFFKSAVLAAASIMPGAIDEIQFVPHDFSSAIEMVGKFSFVLVLLISALIIIRNLITSKKPAQVSPTWGCGYVAPSPAMQYTAKSFSKTMGKLLNFLIIEKKNFEELNSIEIFPVKRSHSAYYTDFFEFRIFDKSANALQWFMNLFQFVQNGSLQRYILYGLFFVVAILLGTLFNLL